jgi:hypothetical protein
LPVKRPYSCRKKNNKHGNSSHFQGVENLLFSRKGKKGAKSENCLSNLKEIVAFMTVKQLSSRIT